MFELKIKISTSVLLPREAKPQAQHKEARNEEGELALDFHALHLSPPHRMECAGAYRGGQPSSSNHRLNPPYPVQQPQTALTLRQWHRVHRVPASDPVTSLGGLGVAE